jgi:phage tail tape measure protein, TP901 family
LSNDGSIKIDTQVNTDELKKVMAKLGELVSSGLSGVKTALKAATDAVAALSTKLAGIGNSAVKTGSSFEAGMSQVQAISGATADELQALADKAKEMGVKTKFSASESAGAMSDMAKAGWRAADMLSGIEGVMYLAAASGENLGTVSNTVIDALTGFGLQAKDSAHFADVLTKAALQSQTNISEMGATFKRVAPLAGTLGYTIEDTAIAVGLMADAGIESEKASTALQSMFSKLNGEVQVSGEAMGNVTIAMSNADGSMKPLRETLMTLREAFAEMTEEEKVANAESLVGCDAMAGFLAIVNGGEEDFNRLTEAIDNASDAAQQQAITMQDNLKGALTDLESAAEGLGIQIYEGVQEPLRDVVDETTKMIDGLSRAFSQGGFEGLVSEVGNFISQIVNVISRSAPDMIAVGTALIFSLLTGIEKNIQKVTKSALDIGMALVNSFVAFVPQMGAIGLRLISELAKNLFGYKIGGKVQVLCSEIQQSFTTLVESAKQAFEPFGTLFKNVADMALDIANKALPVLTDAIAFLFDTCSILLPVLAGVLTAFKAWEIVTTVSGILKTFIASLQTAALQVSLFAAQNGAAAAATAASTAALSAKEVVVGLLTGKIGLATAAQAAWNAIMSANPIALVIAAVAALAVGIGALCMMHEKEQTSAEKLEETYARMGDSLGGIGSAASDYYKGIETAGNILDDFNTSLIVSSEKQQELAAQMEEVQGQITEIARTASERRRDLTEEEIQKLEELFEQMRNLAKGELEIQQQYQQTVMDQAEMFVQTFDGSLEKFREGSQKFINSAAETRQEVVDKAQRQYEEETTLIRTAMDAKNTLYSEAFMAEREQLQSHLETRGTLYTESYLAELEELRKRHEEAGTLDSESYQVEYDALTQTFSERGELYTARYEAELETIRKRHADEKTLYSEAYNEELLAAQGNYDAAVEAADKKCIDTIQIMSDGYEDLAGIRAIFEQGERETNAKVTEESERYIEDLNDIANRRRMYNEYHGYETTRATKGFNRQIEEADQEHAINLERINSEWLANLDKNSQDQLGIWLANLATTEMYGGEISDENQEMVDKILEAYEHLPDDAKQNMQNTMSGMLEGMEKNEPTLFSKASSIANGVLSKLKKAFDINSPSRKTRAIFRDVMEGAEYGLEDETPKLYQQTETISKGVLGAFDGSMATLVDRMKAAVSHEQYRTGMGSMANAGYVSATTSTQRIQQPEANHGPTLVEAHVHLGDATELAVALTPAIEKEMAFAGG